jgi:hypothetical protein
MASTFKQEGVTILFEVYDAHVHLISLRTPIKLRGKGLARKAMEAFLRGHHKPVFLEASPLDRKTSLALLVKFYMSLGFVCTGRKINPCGDPEMVWVRK